MKIAKGTKLLVRSKRKGKYRGIAGSDFDTEDEWYDIVLDEDELEGMVNVWYRGESVPARKGIDFVEVVEIEE